MPNAESPTIDVLIGEFKKLYSATDYVPMIMPTPSCECGADKHGFASHSTWCPKHG